MVQFTISILLTCDIPFIFYDDIVTDRENVIEVTNHDVDVMTNDVEIPTLRPTIEALLVSTRSRRSENVDESTIGSVSD
jgi:hypothetical protein